MKKSFLFIFVLLSVILLFSGCNKKKQYLDKGGWKKISEEDIATITRNFNGSWHTFAVINDSLKDVFIDIKDGDANFFYLDAGQDYDVFYEGTMMYLDGDEEMALFEFNLSYGEETIVCTLRLFLTENDEGDECLDIDFMNGDPLWKNFDEDGTVRFDFTFG